MMQAPDYTYKAEPDPAGDDFAVFQWATIHVEEAIRDEDLWLSDALRERAKIGKEKYGDYLRIHNGRNPLVDYLQEQLDAIMYASQAHLENPGSDTWHLISLSIDAALMAGRMIEKQRGK